MTRRFISALSVALALLALASAGASASTVTLGGPGWQVQSSAVAPQSGAAISTPGFAASGWLRVHNDGGGAPGTEVGALVSDGRCPRVFYGTDMRRCFGYMSTIGPVTVRRFAVPWWFRTTFASPPREQRYATLIVNGVVGEATVWLNGRRVAGNRTVQGAYARYAFDVTGLLRPRANALALEVFPNDPNTMFTLDNVDWTQIPPDNDTGIQFPIQLHTSGALALSDAHVVQEDAPDLSSASLTLRAQVTNFTRRARSGIVSATVTAPSGTAIALQRTIVVPGRSTREVSLTPSAYPQLVISHPSVWWPYQMGAQPLYGLSMSVSSGRVPADGESETFGIRTITTRLVGPSPLAPHGSRQFLVNGVPFVFRAGGWSENLLLHYSPADTANQIALIENLGLNGIRTEGKQMPNDFYEQMDRAGILIDAGFQCCDAWQLPTSGRGVTAHDYEVLYRSALTIGQNMRNHPSVMNFSWSDNNPIPRQEAVSVAAFRRADFQDPLIASAEYNPARGLGWSGEKEGPYDWVPPSYWYDTTHYDRGDPTRTNVGGAWAFDSEASAGATIPTLDSIRRFMTPFEQRELWRAPDYNQYHLNYEDQLPSAANGGYAFGTLHDLDRAMRARYGPWHSLDQYVEEGQVANYETQRAEFEAYIDHSQNPLAPSTGIVYWQLNKGWPTLLWDLYNYDYDEPGSYFGAQEANRPLHAIYAYDTGGVAIDNLTGAAVDGLSVTARVYSLSGQLLDQSSAGPITLASQGVSGALLHPAVPASTAPPQPASTYFVELLLDRDGQLVDRNVYWLSTQADVVNWKRTVGWPQATMTRYADLTGLRSLAPAQVSVSATTAPAAGGQDVTSVRITNTSSGSAPAFFVRADLRRGSAAGAPAGGDDEVLPALWNGNDITLWPGESQTLQVSYAASALRGASPVLTVSGWNVPASAVAAG